MDTLIVLRKPLRKTQFEPKFIVPKKSKKALPKADPIPPSPNLGVGSHEPPISFVKLYKDLCVENSRRANTRVHVNLPTRVHVAAARSELRARSDSSLVTQYRGRVADMPARLPPPATQYRGRVTDMPARQPPPSKARAELLLELDYDTSSKDSGFC